MSATDADANHVYAIVPSDRVHRRKAGGYVVDLGTADDVIRLVMAVYTAPPGMGVTMKGAEE